MIWQPINAAPKDGTEILVRYPHQGNVKKLVFWNTVHGYWSSKGLPELGLEAQSVEWHPLPPDGVAAAHPQQCNCAECQEMATRLMREAAAAAGVAVTDHQTFCAQSPAGPKDE